MLTAAYRNSGSDDGSVANLSTVFDRIGNLSSRTDTYAASEQFCYDPLNRLTNYSVNGATCRAGFGVLKSVTYDDIGNITNKSDLADGSGGTGTYSYNLPTHPLPHAVMSISGTVNGTQNPGYRYDADGNLTCEYTGPNCSHGAITKETDAWWSFNMAHTISEGTTSLTFTYDSEHARILQALTNGSTTVTTTYLNDAISGGMEDHVVSGSTTTWNDYLMADGKLIAERSCSATTPTCSAPITTQYLITDHLGSVGVVTDGTPGSSTFAQVTARESFDAWGRERNPDWSDDPTCSTPLTAPSTRGFTGQEEIASLCLVNLNARIYDPSIGRFTSADSVIPDPYDGQSYNRYSYTSNRPLSLTDPTGHDPFPGSCGIGCIPAFSDQLPPSSYPNARCFGDCPFGSGIGPSEDPSGTTLLDRVAANGGKNLSISQNSNGDNALTLDPTQNETAMSGLPDSTQAQIPSSGASTEIETVVVKPEQTLATSPDLTLHYSVIFENPFQTGNNGVLPGGQLVKFYLSTGEHEDGDVAQHVRSWIIRPDGTIVPVSDFSESFGEVKAGKTDTERFHQVGFDDRFAIISISGHGVYHVEGDARFYSGITDLPPDWKIGSERLETRPAFDLLAKPGMPDLPLNNATPVLHREVNIPF
jgi:RHS repeat-associated protein